MSQEKKERNEELYRLWKGRPATLTEIAKQFNITPAAAWRIIQRYANQETTNAK
jgi:Mor family transcriptional regulator